MAERNIHEIRRALSEFFNYYKEIRLAGITEKESRKIYSRLRDSVSYLQEINGISGDELMEIFDPSEIKKIFDCPDRIERRYNSLISEYSRSSRREIELRKDLKNLVEKLKEARDIRDVRRLLNGLDASKES
ncbi:MAG TPA: hypothetical protein VJ208_01845 [Candidatus Nanoarchaeia archaeon]|nr:hypothetical protein [Candidatus Nanoarchaeia archaeon]